MEPVPYLDLEEPRPWIEARHSRSYRPWCEAEFPQGETQPDWEGGIGRCLVSE